MRSLDFLFGLPQPDRRRLRAAAFLAVLAAAAFLRFDGLGEPSLWLDEILHVEQARSARAEMDDARWTRWPSALTRDQEDPITPRPRSGGGRRSQPGGGLRLDRSGSVTGSFTASFTASVAESHIGWSRDDEGVSRGAIG